MGITKEVHVMSVSVCWPERRDWNGLGLRHNMEGELDGGGRKKDKRGMEKKINKQPWMVTLPTQTIDTGMVARLLTGAGWWSTRQTHGHSIYIPSLLIHQRTNSNTFNYQNTTMNLTGCHKVPRRTFTGNPVPAQCGWWLLLYPVELANKLLHWCSGAFRAWLLRIATKR